MKKFRIVILVLLSLCALSMICYFILPQLPIGSHPIDHINSLLIGVDDFPTGWKVDYEKPLTGDEDWGVENIDIGIKLETGHGYAHQHIYRFRSGLDAIYAHFFLFRDLSIIKENLVDFLNYKSPIANDWYIGCTIAPSKNVVCDTFGRYEDYIVYFSITASSDQLTPAQLEKILHTIDDRMAKHLMK